ncbi:S8 family serine peptidase [Georgenia daeguensis]|uniref:Peptidase S8/S53 domain-containing protein n=1 Tax=Georgenia daeguensis TaxID=908355 RepID=A0ABP8EX11_9MICO
MHTDTYAVLRHREPVPLSVRSPAASARSLGDGVVALPEVDVARLSKDELREVAGHPEVRAVAPVMPTRLIFPVAKPRAVTAVEAGPAWGVAAVGADRSLRTGAGVTVAVLDTGIDVAHPAFAGATVVEEDFTGSGNGDVQGHGTHCAGTVLGRDVDGARIGVAPGVGRVLAGKVLGDDGSGDSTMLFNGIQWALREGAHVISMSLGFDFPGLVQRLVDDGWPADLATSAALEGYRANLRMFDAGCGGGRRRGEREPARRGPRPRDRRLPARRRGRDRLGGRTRQGAGRVRGRAVLQHVPAGGGARGRRGLGPSAAAASRASAGRAWPLLTWPASRRCGGRRPSPPPCPGPPPP